MEKHYFVYYRYQIISSTLYIEANEAKINFLFFTGVWFLYEMTIYIHTDVSVS